MILNPGNLASEPVFLSNIVFYYSKSFLNEQEEMANKLYFGI